MPAERALSANARAVEKAVRSVAAAIRDSAQKEHFWVKVLLIVVPLLLSAMGYVINEQQRLDSAIASYLAQVDVINEELNPAGNYISKYDNQPNHCSDDMWNLGQTKKCFKIHVDHLLGRGGIGSKGIPLPDPKRLESFLQFLSVEQDTLVAAHKFTVQLAGYGGKLDTAYAVARWQPHRFLKDEDCPSDGFPKNLCSAMYALQCSYERTLDAATKLQGKLREERDQASQQTGIKKSGVC